MSKPQMASEPSMEEILASIRKMIADDTPGPSPLPDAMGRTPFGDTRQAFAPDTGNLPDAGNLASTDKQTPARTSNSLTDALKVATALSDQRRALQPDPDGASEKTPRNNLEALTELASSRSETARNGNSNGSGTELRNARTGAHTPLPFGLTDADAENATQSAEPKPDLLSFDFGTMVPQRNEAQPQPRPQPQAKSQPQPTDTKPISLQGMPSMAPAPVSTTPAGAHPLSEAEPDPATEPRVLPLRVASNGFNGSGPNVAPFPRPARETAKAAASATPPSAEHVDVAQPAAKPEAPAKPEAAAKVEAPAKPEATAKAEALPKLEMPFASSPAHKADAPAPLVAPEPVKPMSAMPLAPSANKPDDKPVASKPSVAEPLAASSEALLDAVVDLVQQQPDALSVFASGASFISGVNDKKESGGQTLPVLAHKVEVASDGAAAQPAKLDRAAAELLRPMLRQWLAENMERILEDALRSELTAQIEQGKGPGKS